MGKRTRLNEDECEGEENVEVKTEMIEQEQEQNDDVNIDVGIPQQQPSLTEIFARVVIDKIRSLDGSEDGEDGMEVAYEVLNNYCEWKMLEDKKINQTNTLSKTQAKQHHLTQQLESLRWSMVPEPNTQD